MKYPRTINVKLYLSNKEKFDDIFDITKLYISDLALTCAVQIITLCPILLISIPCGTAMSNWLNAFHNLNR
jgi:hypothetical protein